MIRVLLDEGLDVRLRLYLSPELQVETVHFRGWKGKRNGDLLRLAEEDFDVLMTFDASLRYQQNLSRFAIAIIVLRPRTQSLADLIELVPQLNRDIISVRVSEVREVLPPTKG